MTKYSLIDLLVKCAEKAKCTNVEQVQDKNEMVRVKDLIAYIDADLFIQALNEEREYEIQIKRNL